GEVAKTRPVDQLSGWPCFGANADHQREQHQRDGRADQRLLEDEWNAGGARGRARFGGGDRHVAQTFSTSGRPSRPVGRKMSTTIRIEKAATSLYSTEK